MDQAACQWILLVICILAAAGACMIGGAAAASDSSAPALGAFIISLIALVPVALFAALLYGAGAFSLILN